MIRLLQIILVFLAALGGISALQADTPFVAGTGLSGAWYNPDRNGEGFLVEILDGDRALVTWFTYDTQGEQMWLIGTGQIDGDTLFITDVKRTSGPVFGPGFDPGAVLSSDWGSLVFRFQGCNGGTVHYDGPPEFGSGDIDITRLSELQGAPCDASRPFAMGFTAFPYAASVQGVDEAFRIIREEADLAVLHFDDGVPWPEALTGNGIDAYPEALKSDWQGKKDRLPAGHKLLVSITPIAISRDALAPYNNGVESLPLSSIGQPWQEADFSHPDVVQAFTQHARNVLEFFHPDYLLIGIEVNLLRTNKADLWPGYVSLQQQVYAALKAEFPSQVVLLSFLAADLMEGYSDADVPDQLQALREVEPYTDYFGISIYPYLTAFGTGPLPDDLFAKMATISDKPYAIAESGYFSEQQSFDIGNGVRITLEGSEEKQQQWIARLLAEAERRNYRFVVNFVNRDYDPLCVQLMCEDLVRVWEASGLVDEAGDAKPALTTWRNYLFRPLRK